MFLSTSCFFPAHTKSIMYFSNSLRIWIGIEKISVRYYSLDKIKMLTTCTLPIKDSFLGFQNAPLFLILASCSVKIISEVSLFPIHSPKAKTLSSIHLQSKGFSTYQRRALQFCRYLPSRQLLAHSPLAV